MKPDTETIDPEAMVLIEEFELPELSGEPAQSPRIVAELVIEEISIDGMCGVY